MVRIGFRFMVWFGIGLFSLFVFWGCDLDRRAEGFEVPDVPPRIVFGTFLGDNDTMTWIRVTASHPVRFNEWRIMEEGSSINASPFRSLREASVSFRNETLGQEAPLQYHDSLDGFVVSVQDFPIVSGHTYSVEASSEGFSTARGSCRIPSGVDLDFSVGVGEERSLEFRIEVPKEPLRYFLVRGKSNENALYSFTSEFVCSSDESRDGVLVVQGFDFWREFKWLPFRLYEIDEHTYHYYTSSEEQYGMLSGFFSNPSVVYTNIQNGLGVVGGMRFMSEANAPQ